MCLWQALASFGRHFPLVRTAQDLNDVWLALKPFSIGRKTKRREPSGTVSDYIGGKREIVAGTVIGTHRSSPCAPFW